MWFRAYVQDNGVILQNSIYEIQFWKVTRELNILNWPEYYPVPLNNDIGKVCVTCETLMFLKNLKLVHRHLLVHVVEFFNQELFFKNGF